MGALLRLWYYDLIYSTYSIVSPEIGCVIKL